MTPPLACIPHDQLIGVLMTLRATAAEFRLFAQGKCPTVANLYAAKAASIEDEADGVFNAVTYRTRGGA